MITKVYTREDAELTKAKTLPAADGTEVSESIDLGAHDVFIAPCEMLVNAPILTVTEIPDADTATYKIEQSADNSSWSDLETSIIVQTGAGGAGAAAAEIRLRLITSVLRHIRLSVTTAGTSGDMSGKSMTLKLLT